MSTSSLSYRPQSRTDGLVITRSETDVIIYDSLRHELHTLNAAAAAVWHAADGSSTLAEITAATQLDNATVDHTLHQLTRAGLLVNGLDVPRSSARRRLMKKGALLSIPMIVSVSVPLAGAAASLTCATTPFYNKDCPVVGAPCWTGGKAGAGNCGTCKPKDASTNHCDKSA